MSNHQMSIDGRWSVEETQEYRDNVAKQEKHRREMEHRYDAVEYGWLKNCESKASCVPNHDDYVLKATLEGILLLVFAPNFLVPRDIISVEEALCLKGTFAHELRTSFAWALPRAIRREFGRELPLGHFSQRHPQCILSGSLVLQVLLGEAWDGADLDLFCTAQASSLVRTRLVQLGLVFSGTYTSSYQHIGHSSDVPNVVKQVEKWSLRTATYNHRTALRAGKEYLEWAEEHYCFEDKAWNGFPGKLEPGSVKLPFDSYGCGGIQLIVVNGADASEALSSFDLT
jgi:hypothetical protein